MNQRVCRELWLGFRVSMSAMLLAGVAMGVVSACSEDAPVDPADAPLPTGAVSVAVTYPDETLQDAIGTMLKRNIGRLPVVARSDPGKVLGYLGRADILAARSRLHEEEELRERGPLLAPAARPQTGE